MQIRKLTEIKEIDEIIPLIQKLYQELGIDKYLSLAGYISWITISFPSSNFQIWKGVDGEVVKGYLIAHITQRFLVSECSIIDAFIEVNDESVTREVYDFIINWAKSEGCKQLSIVSKRDKAFVKKYGFEEFGTILIQKI